MILVLPALPIEFHAFSAALALPSVFETRPVGRCSVNFASGVAWAIGGHGKVQFALTTQHLIQALQPRLVIGVGGAGGLCTSLKPLDVVVSEAVVEHDYNLRCIRRPPPEFPAHRETIEKLRGSARVGRIASGDEDVIDRARAEEIAAFTGAIAVAWEGAGLARACRWHSVPFVELRVITDMASPSAAADYQAHVEQAMQKAADVVRLLIEPDCSA